MVIAAILIMVSAEIVSNVSTSMPSVGNGSDTSSQGYAANKTIANITSGTYNGLQLMTVLPVVLAAAAIISAVVGGFMILRARQ